MHEPGDILPDFELHLAQAGPRRLSDYSGRWVVLYFYPKDSTPACTQEGIDFRDLAAKFKHAGATILGVSRDSVKSHQNFCAKYEFPFALISDADERVCTAFDVIHEKTMYGRKALGIVRSTFLIDPAGCVAQQWRGLRVPGHAAAVLDALKAARTASADR